MKVLAGVAGQALHVLDRFHITQQLHKAVDEVRRTGSNRPRALQPVRVIHVQRFPCREEIEGALPLAVNCRDSPLRAAVRLPAACQLGHFLRTPELDQRLVGHVEPAGVIPNGVQYVLGPT